MPGDASGCATTSSACSRFAVCSWCARELLLVPALIRAPQRWRPGFQQRENERGPAISRTPSDLSLAEWTGLEPATPGVTGRYSNQLNYHSVVNRSVPYQVLVGADGFEPPTFAL